MNKSQIMKNAWGIRKSAAAKFSCPVSEINFSDCLKQAWTEAKGEKMRTVEIKIDIFNLEEFAGRVLNVANSAPTGRHGLEKVFISHVWKYFKEHGFDNGMSYEDFKQYLLQANRANYLTLSQEDIPGQLPADDIRNSATPYLNATFHYIRVGKHI
jgi:hypothetical protein